MLCDFIWGYNSVQSILSKRASLHSKLKQEEQINSELRCKLEKFESLANVGMVSAMIAHEINNILTPVGSYAEMAIADPTDEYIVNKAVQKAASNSQRATQILGSLLNMAKGNSKKCEIVSFDAILSETFSCLARDLKKDSISVKIDVAPNTQIFCDSIAIQQVLLNLLLNAREAMLGKGGYLSICAYATSNETVLSIKDTGEGIGKEDVAKIFDPFFTTKSRDDKRHNAGSGLGLAYCKKVVDSHAGEITVESSPETGTKFEITLPLPQDEVGEK